MSGKRPINSRFTVLLTLAWIAGGIGGCDAVVFERRAPLFYTPLTVDGESVGDAIVDTGGGYEIILKESFGLKVTDTVEVLAFGGKEFVAVTEPFAYQVADVAAQADFALVGLSACACNGIGFHFLRRHGMSLALDFSTMEARFFNGPAASEGTVTLPFDFPPVELAGFDTAFLEVVAESGGQSRTVLALLDTGSNGTAVREGLFPIEAGADPRRQDLLLTRTELGTVQVRAVPFDTSGLPDLIIGTDVMGAWADRWIFTFAPVGGEMKVVPRKNEGGGSGDSPAAESLP